MNLFWHRRDLRIDARAGDAPVIPIYILEDGCDEGKASDWWLHRALVDLENQYREKACDLLIVRGDPETLLLETAIRLGCTSVSWNIVWEPKEYKRDDAIIKKLKDHKIDVKRYNNNYLIDPREVLTKGETPYGVFTPFWNQFQKVYRHKRAPKPPELAHQKTRDEIDLPKTNAWMKKLEKHWDPTKNGAKDLTYSFSFRVEKYGVDRDFPAINGTSKLSPYLHFGQVSPSELYEKFSDVEPFIRELGWREFANYFLFHYPHIETENWNKKFDKVQWRDAPKDLEKWKKGLTGFPIVDAGMRQLWQTGWMHNRVRMIVASFLTKDLRIDWRHGAKWFMETLVDADLASNAMNWQWVAGCGPDAAPYFRIFNPTIQSQKFDKQGEYIKKFVPELRSIDPKWIHEPSLAPPDLFHKCNYPDPIVDHAKARIEALALFQE